MSRFVTHTSLEGFVGVSVYSKTMDMIGQFRESVSGCCRVVQACQKSIRTKEHDVCSMQTEAEQAMYRMAQIRGRTLMFATEGGYEEHDREHLLYDVTLHQCSSCTMRRRCRRDVSVFWTAFWCVS